MKLKVKQDHKILFLKIFEHYDHLHISTDSNILVIFLKKIKQVVALFVIENLKPTPSLLEGRHYSYHGTINLRIIRTWRSDRDNNLLDLSILIVC